MNTSESLKNEIQGSFHFHSTYSHDGRSTLSEIASVLAGRGLSFCVMTEHFEDFDAPKCNRYLEEMRSVSENSGVLLIPGMEVDLSGLHTIVFPVHSYDQVAGLASNGRDRDASLFKVLAHPSKYAFERVGQHIEQYRIDGIELWNQQADGSHIPPIKFLEYFKTQPWRHRCRYFFGCDIHNVKLAVANTLVLSRHEGQTPDSIVKALMSGAFRSRNLATGIECRNREQAADFDAWLQDLIAQPFYRGKLLHGVRTSLKTVYKSLPRETQRSLNDVKNYVRSKL